MERLTWRELREIEDYFAREQAPPEPDRGGFDPALLPFTEEAG